MSLFGWLVGIFSGVGALACVTALGDLLSEEIRGRLDRAPHLILRLAARRLPPGLRDENLVGWKADLYEYLRGAEATPVTRLWRGMRCAFGALTSTGAIIQAFEANRSKTTVAEEKRVPVTDSRLSLVEAVGYRGVTASHVAGVSDRQLEYWARTTLVVPSIRDASGSGTQCLYSFRDLVVLKVVKRLLDAGVSLQNIRKAIETLRWRGVEDLAGITLISDGTTMYECRSPEEVVDLLQGGHGVFGIVIGGAFKEIGGSLSNLPSEPAA